MDNYYPRIRDIREDKDLKQINVAHVLGITQQTYQLYESGIRAIPVGLLCRLADYYDENIDYMLGRTNINKKELDKAVRMYLEKRI